LAAANTGLPSRAARQENKPSRPGVRVGVTIEREIDAAPLTGEDGFQQSV
jgi:hypothetical protein